MLGRAVDVSAQINVIDTLAEKLPAVAEHLETGSVRGIPDCAAINAAVRPLSAAGERRDALSGTRRMKIREGPWVRNRRSVGFRATYVSCPVGATTISQMQIACGCS
jgi:hypothetical protein